MHIKYRFVLIIISFSFFDLIYKYILQGSLKTFVNLSTLVIHHTVMRENLPATLVLPLMHATLNSQQQSSLHVIRSVRF